MNRRKYKKRENSQLKATEGRGNFPSISENENESHDLDLIQSVFQREKEGCPSIAVIWKLHPASFDYIYWCHLPKALTENMAK